MKILQKERYTMNHSSYICFFSYGLSNMDCLTGQVIGKTDTKLFIRAFVPHDPQTAVYGFAFWQTPKHALIGAEAVVGIMNELDSGDFIFKVESLKETSSLVLIRRKKEESAKQAEIA